jgi:ATP-dependent Clp protease protease subunit
MFDRRIVLVRGRLDGQLAGQVAAALLGLDLSGAEPIHIYLSSYEGELAAAFTIADAIGAVSAPVHAVVTGETGGASLAVLAAVDRRLAFGHARVRLVEPRAAAIAGTADEVAAAAGRYLRELDELIVMLAEVTGQPRSRIESDLDARRILSATEAKEYGLIEEILGPKS